MGHLNRLVRFWVGFKTQDGWIEVGLHFYAREVPFFLSSTTHSTNVSSMYMYTPPRWRSMVYTPSGQAYPKDVLLG